MHEIPLPSARLHVLAPAKVNLQLRVVGLRPDGFHELDTSMLAIDWCDELWLGFRAAPGLGFAVDGAYAGEVPAGDGNLAWRAAARAKEDCAGPGPKDLGIQMHLRKHLPSGAGLGGGSSDAAASFLGCQALLDSLGASPRVSGQSLERAAQALASLGSDCVFFAQAAETGLARCTGRGELVQALEPSAHEWWIAVVVPSVQALTAAVYAARRTMAATRLSTDAPETRVAASLLDQPLYSARQALFNDLETAAFAVVPELGRWRALLDQGNLHHWRLSGSGSSFFGLYQDPNAARADLEQVGRAAKAAGLDWRAQRLARPARHGVRWHWI